MLRAARAAGARRAPAGVSRTACCGDPGWEIPRPGRSDAEGEAISQAQQRMSQLVRQKGPVVDRLIEIEFLDRAAEAFAFTFN